MKNRFLALILGLLIVPTYALAQVGGGGGVSSPSYMRPSSTSGLIPTTGFNELGTSSTRWSKGYFTDFDISGVLTFGGTMGGNFDLTANDLLHVDSIFGSTAILPVRIGDAATTSHSLASEDDLLVTGRLEVNGRSDFDGNVWFNAGGVNISTNMDISNDVAIKNVSNQGGIYPLRTAQTPDSSLLVTGPLSNAWHLMEYADGTFDFAFPIQTNPTFVYHSANQSTTEWGSLAHDQTNFVIGTGAGAVQVAPVATFGLDIQTTGSKVACAAGTRGQIFLEEGASGVTDTVYMCMKAVADTYSWISITTGG